MTSHYDPEAGPTLWRAPDDSRAELQPLVPEETAPGTAGRPAVPFRRVLDGVLYVLRTGCQWKAAPAAFGPGSPCHRRVQEGVEHGIWQRLWADHLARYDREHSIGWAWQAADSATAPSPLGGDATGPNPTDRGERGTKRQLLRDERGAPLAALIAAASRSDMRVADARGYQAHTPKRGEERPDPPPDQRWPARRWIIERSFAWKARFRRLARDYERLPQIVAGLHFVACLRLLRALREVPSNHG